MRFQWRLHRKRLLLAAAVCLALGAVGTFWVSHRLTTVFEARERDSASRLLGRAYPLRAGTPGSARELSARLDRLGYRRIRGRAADAGSYSVRGDAVEVSLRAFRDLEGDHPAKVVDVAYDEGSIAEASPAGSFIEPETLAVFQGPSLEERDIIQVGDCPKHLIDAILAAEDRRFYMHPGLDPGGILRALQVDLSSGSLAQGGSTLTQQLAKNLFFNGERTFSRKAAEAFAAVVLEVSYPKERILRAYLNEVYLGQRGASSVLGFGSAARHYFGKNVHDLSLAESALLAGLIRAPGIYNPFLHPERARDRRDAVLKAMEETGAIKQAERQAAAREPVRVKRSRSGGAGPHGAYIAELIRHDLETSYGADFWRLGLRVHTSIDPVYQEAAESAVSDELRRLERGSSSLRRGRDGKPLQAALVSVDLRDGSIVAMVGGRDFETSQFNRVTSAKRQPGSLFKPIVYLAGLTAPGSDGKGDGKGRRTPNADRRVDDKLVEVPSDGGDVVPVRWDRSRRDRAAQEGDPPKKRHRFHWWWQKPDPTDSEPEPETPPANPEADEVPSLPFTAATILRDEPYEVQAGGKTWAPQNDDETFRGPVTVQRALEQSLNVPTARAAAAIGLERVVEMGRSLGISSTLPAVPSLALGSADVTPLEMTTVFSTIALGGVRRTPTLRVGVEGEARRPGSANEDTVVVPEMPAHLMTALLEGVLDQGTARSARDLGFAGVAAGKTGTSDEGRDLWFCGYTPKVLTLVWVGFDDNRPTHLTGARAALPIWVDYMVRIGADRKEPFEGDGDLVWAKIDPTTGSLAGSHCPEDRLAPFIPGTEPVEECTEHRSWWSRLFE